MHVTLVLTLILCFQHATLFKTKLRHRRCLATFVRLQSRCSLVNLRNFPGFDFIKSNILAEMFPCGFYKIFKNTYFAEHQQSTVSNDMILTRFFCKIYYSLKSKSKNVKTNCFAFKNIYISLFTFLAGLKTTNILLLCWDA